MNHIQFCWVSSHSNELSFCLFVRHSDVNLWTCCQFLCLDLCRWPWLHIYTGMSADGLSGRVNIPPDYCLFAQIRTTDPKQLPLVHLVLPLHRYWSSCGGEGSSASALYCDKCVFLPFKAYSISHLSCIQTCSSQSSLCVIFLHQY